MKSCSFSTLKGGKEIVNAFSHKNNRWKLLSRLKTKYKSCFGLNTSFMGIVAPLPNNEQRYLAYIAYSHGLSFVSNLRCGIKWANALQGAYNLKGILHKSQKAWVFQRTAVETESGYVIIRGVDQLIRWYMGGIPVHYIFVCLILF